MAERYIGDEELKFLSEVVESTQLWRNGKGNFTGRFEEEFGKHVGRKYVHAVNSGTSANEAAIAGCGIQPGDEVICTPCSMIASSISIVANGGIPVFADVDPLTLLVTAEEIEKKITERSKAVVVVHLFGQPAQMEPILDVAERHNLMVIEDCAQSYDAYYEGKMVGSLGDVACWSLQQSKHITTGEGGIVATDDAEVYKRVVLYSNCGMPWLFQYELDGPTAQPMGSVPTRGHFAFGHNYRMSELQSAVALAQLAKIQRFNELRKKLVEIIETELQDVPGIHLAHIYPDTKPNYWAYPVWLDREQTNLTAMEVAKLCKNEEGVEIGYYQEVNYLEAVYQQMEKDRRTSMGYPLPDYVHYEPGICPNAEKCATQLIPIGTHHGTEPEHVAKIVRAIKRVMERHL